MTSSWPWIKFMPPGAAKMFWCRCRDCLRDEEEGRRAAVVLTQLSSPTNLVGRYSTICEAAYPQQLSYGGYLE